MPSDPNDARTASAPPAGGAHFVLQLGPGEAAIAAPAQQTLLASALAAGIELRSSCRNGTCRACLCRVTAGQHHLRYRVDWPGLSPEERAEGGWTLPCVALADGDVAIDATLDPRTSPR